MYTDNHFILVSLDHALSRYLRHQILGAPVKPGMAPAAPAAA